MEEKAVRGFAWTFLGLGVNKAVSTATTVVLAALVSPSDFGLMTVGIVLINFVSWFGGSSFGSTLIVHQNLGRRGQGTILSLSLLGALAAAAATVAAAPGVASLIHQPRLTGVLAVLSASIVLSGASSFYEALLQNHLEFRRRFAALTTQTLSFTATAIGLAAAGAGVWSLVAGEVVSVALFTVALVVLAPVRVTPAWSRIEVGELFAVGRGFALQGLTQFVRQNADTVSIGRTFGAASIGCYAMAFRLGDLTYSALADPIARVTFPAFARALSRGEDVRPAFLGVLRSVSLVTIPAGLILSAVSAPFTHSFFGPEWGAMIGVLNLAGVWAAIRPIVSTIGWLLNSLGRAAAVARVAVFVLLPLVAGLVAVLSSGDLRLVALVPLGDTIISLAILATLAGRHAHVSAAAMGRALAPVAVAGAVCWAAARACATALDAIAPVPALGVSALVGLGAFTAAVLVLDRELIVSLVRQVTRVLGR